jgi:Spx/MgsR family transcriptional regulator
MTQPILYGLSKCDTCAKARKWLDRFGVAYHFVDYREHRIPPETLKAWAAQVGGWSNLVNKSGTTWRNLPPARQSPESDPEWTLLLREHPALVRRPVVTIGDRVSVGFTDKLFRDLFPLDASPGRS